MREKGRSMVEMLGVLAIIGVLSVGAIAGYSKAMMKYKLNKFAFSLNMLFSYYIQMQSQFTIANESSNFNAALFSKLNLIPEGMRYQGGVIRDIFNNQIQITYGYIHFSFDRVNNKISQSGIESCIQIVNASKPFVHDINLIDIRSGNNENYYTSNPIYGHYGDFACPSPNKSCLDSISFNDIYDKCASCESDLFCNLVIYFRYKYKT